MKVLSEFRSVVHRALTYGRSAILDLSFYSRFMLRGAPLWTVVTAGLIVLGAAADVTFILASGHLIQALAGIGTGHANDQSAHKRAWKWAWLFAATIITGPIAVTMAHWTASRMVTSCAAYTTDLLTDDHVCVQCTFRPSCQGAACPLERIRSGSRPCPSEKHQVKQILQIMATKPAAYGPGPVSAQDLGCLKD